MFQTFKRYFNTSYLYRTIKTSKETFILTAQVNHTDQNLRITDIIRYEPGIKNPSIYSIQTSGHHYIIGQKLQFNGGEWETYQNMIRRKTSD